MAIMDLRKMYTLGGGSSDQGVGSNRDPYGNLFPPGPMPPPPPEEPSTNAVDDIMKLYAPETEASARFRQLLEEYPERQDPSFARRITSGLLGIGTMNRAGGGIDTQDKVLQGPNDRRLSDWEKKIRPAEVASSQENQRNVNSRNLAALELRDRQAQEKLASTEKIAAEKAEIARQSQAIQMLKFNNPELDFDFSGPKVIVTNPRPAPGTSGITVTNIDTGKVDDATKLLAAQKRAETMAAGATERANVAAETSRQNAELAGNQVFTEAGSQLPVVVRSRAAGGPEQVPVKNATPIQRVPGTKGPSTGTDLARVRSMSNEALRRIKNDFLVMPKDPTKGTPTLNPGIKIRIGYGTWNPEQYLPESPERRAAAAQKNLKDLLTLSLIGEMKEQSRTGATGFGQLTGRELDVLESAATRLDWAQDEATITQELIEILGKLEKIMMPGEGEEGTSSIQLATKFRQNKRDGRREVSTDGGLTWKPYVPPQQ